MKIELCPEYEITEDGDVYSLPKYGGGKGRGRFTKMALLKGSVGKNGYKYVNIKTVNGKKKVYVHRLVALAYIDNKNKLPTVNHKDGNKLNNDVNNLEWASMSDQMRHAHRLGLRVTTEKQRAVLRENIKRAIESNRGRPSWNKGLHFLGQPSWRSLI